MRVLFVHHNFPAQFCHLAPHLAARKQNEVVAVGDRLELAALNRPVPGVKLFGYDLPPLDTRSDTAEIRLQRALHRGAAVVAGAKHLALYGFRPDVIVAHPAWGEGLFLKDYFPQAKLLLYCENYFRVDGGELGFDPEFTEDDDAVMRYRVVSAALPLTLDTADRGIAPTLWQRNRFPKWFRPRIDVVHDGIDTEVFAPRADADFRLPDGRRLARSQEIVTFIARSLEPHRGFHTFMRAIPEIQRRRPKAHIVIVGGDAVSYSAPLPQGESYRQRMLRELDGQIDLDRLHFCGRISQSDILSLLQVSSVHIYLVYPMGLSWSVLEAMSTGCLVVASRTGPIEEVIEDGRNGWLVDFFSPAQITERVEIALRDASRSSAMRVAARRAVVKHYDLRHVCLPAQTKLLEQLVAK